MIEKVFLFWGGKKFYLTGGGPDDVISRDHHNYKNVTIVFFCFCFFIVSPKETFLLTKYACNTSPVLHFGPHYNIKLINV